jgi:co-chaperonin GroES (HSP10)
VVINQPKDTVSYIKYLKNQDNTASGQRLTQNEEKFYRDGTVGAIATWESDNKEVGIENKIKKIKEGEQVDFELRFKSSI